MAPEGDERINGEAAPPSPSGFIGAGSNPHRPRPGGRAIVYVGLAGLVLAAAVGFVATRGGGGGSAHPPRGTTAVSPPVAGPGDRPGQAGPELAPARGALFGAFVARDPTPGSSLVAAYQAFESRLGRRLDIVQSYYPFETPFPTDLERTVLDAGQIPLISWNGTDTAAVVSGSQDALIAQRADAVKALGKPILLRWFWEMDGNRKAHFVDSPGGYIAAWRHIRDVFRRHGATNAAFVWCPDGFAFDNGRAQLFYPGDDSVDWVCADGYDMTPVGTAASRLKTFQQAFAGFYAFGQQHGKPMMVGEFGETERPDDQRAKWLADARDVLKTRFPAIRAVVYWEAIDRRTNYDARVSSSPGSLAALRAIALDPWFRVRPSS